MTQTTAVLLMAYGGPESLEDVEPFLRDIRGGRPTSPRLIEEIRQRYAAIGGRSPLLEITREQALGLERLLNHDRVGASSKDCPRRFCTYVGMRHWRPKIRDAVAEIVAAGHTEIVALCLAPHYSQLSIGAYLERLGEAVAEHRRQGAVLRIAAVESWGEHPLLLDTQARKVRETLERWPESQRHEVEVMFTAHSLPRSILDRGDPYPDQLLATARGVARRLVAGGSELCRWSLCYQSAGARSIPWLGPALDEVIAERAAAGCRHFLVAPIGFVSDHVEILYDLDIETQRIAHEHGIRLERTDSLNTDPGLLAALAALVRDQLGRFSAREALPVEAAGA